MQLMPFYTAAVHRPLTRVAGMGWQNLSEYVLQAFLGTSKQLRQQLRPWIYKLCEYALTKKNCAFPTKNMVSFTNLQFFYMHIRDVALRRNDYI